jgi:hypothetical protein
MEPLQPAQRDAVLDALLANATPARVVAINETGFFVPMPSSVPLTTQSVIEVPGAYSTALDLVVGADMRRVIETWATASISSGAARSNWSTRTITSAPSRTGST